ncbi:MSMEG_0567/Sll0786 family nitrogen starvation N-acetyltransferase [Variovorax sp. Varisp85]|jgi:putative N-acetyltransferase (TIGR04045 family)|uniref:MSMEG_0567/Sll0786 family nitrogen starvation N-acetyltransferase n=1 Tax=unclassified Variovorax TaxID=663243 RepID=UPI0002712F2D|nr:MSMEG_0567/Sll0786 family nitrogen starvation N-acetyltransferase [Variovorax sp. CF313]EJL75503.1 putative N-acetyltransferase [Variovorax sp. CF313]
MLCIDDLSELDLHYAPVEYLVREAAQQWERDEAMGLRRAVFCIEQGIFVRDDRDAIDDHAQLLVAMSCAAGMPEQVVGTVRIHRGEADGEWWGSRLAVHPAFRSQGHLGVTLIRLAVSRANALGCKRFFAQVQMQNVPLFRKLGWQLLEETGVHGRPHARMQAELGWYPPCHDPVSGFVTRSKVLP